MKLTYFKSIICIIPRLFGILYVTIMQNTVPTVDHPTIIKPYGQLMKKNGPIAEINISTIISVRPWFINFLVLPMHYNDI